ncbi:MAG: glutamate racemase [Alkaliphilus sp.]|nr:MAG: glutamate racemase [Alkaliphilus sp.]
MQTKLEKQKKTIDLPIGVFDSGIGGISVLAELISEMPNESFVYFADSANAPYGEKTTEEVKRLSMVAVNFLVDYGIKALVVACNTATSAAVNELRNKWEMPIVGMEPALKPAVESDINGKIVVMATPVTIKEEKFSELVNKFRNSAEIIKLPCPGLALLIERIGSESVTHEEEIERYLKRVFEAISFNDNDAIVLGCTHYIFIKDNITRMIDKDVSLFDGNNGTVMQLDRLINGNRVTKKKNTDENSAVVVEMINSCKFREKKEISEKILLNSLEKLSFKGRVNFV